MVCIYCGGSTSVNNSRLTSHLNEVWRRRQCKACHAIFTTYESATLEGSIVVQYSGKDLRPFLYEQLFVDIFACCNHMSQSATVASNLSKVIAVQIGLQASSGVISRGQIIDLCIQYLERIDSTALALYKAYHT